MGDPTDPATNIKKKCAFCGQGGPFTREHIWPQSLQRHVQDLAEGDGPPDYWVLRLREQEKLNDPVLKDVCASCNNGQLSVLDTYAAGLFKDQLSRRYERNDEFDFEFDYHLLKRWLLKVSFNSARINKSVDLPAFEELLPYITGKDDGAGRSVPLYVRIVYPGKTTLQLKERYPDLPDTYYPIASRTGHALIVGTGGAQEMLRAVHIFAFTFMIGFYDKSVGAAFRDKFNNKVISHFENLTLLRPSRQIVKLKCNGGDALQELMASREYRLPMLAEHLATLR